MSGITTNETAMSGTVDWVDINLVLPNPYQPRREFVDESLTELADSIAQYGILQPLTVSEVISLDESSGKESKHYELVAGERRLRASKIAGLARVPVIIRMGDTNKTKLELAIIENLQREDLNPVDRAKAFLQLASEFNLSHTEIGKRMGKSREYVSNSLRLLALPEIMLSALAAKKISEGHTRPLLMLSDKPEEQLVLFNDIMNYKMSVRAAEARARKSAQEKVRKEHLKTDRKILDIEETLSKRLHARVAIESAREGEGGRIVISYMNPEELGDLIRTVGDTDGSAAVSVLREKISHDQVKKGINVKNSGSESDKSKAKSFSFKTGFIDDVNLSDDSQGDMLSRELVMNDSPTQKEFNLIDAALAPEIMEIEIPEHTETKKEFDTIPKKQITELIDTNDSDDEWMPLSEFTLNLTPERDRDSAPTDTDANTPQDLEFSNISDQDLDTNYSPSLDDVKKSQPNNDTLYSSLFNV